MMLAGFVLKYKKQNIKAILFQDAMEINKNNMPTFIILQKHLVMFPVGICDWSI